MRILGIDPGSTGGICQLSEDRSFYHLCKASPIDADTVRTIKEMVTANPTRLAVVERVASFPGQGVASTFTFGKRYGVILGALMALGVPVVDVPPQTWNKALGLSQPKGFGLTVTAVEKKKRLAARRKEQKSRNYAMARNLFPHLAITLETADGVLLAEYGLRTL